VAVHCNGALYCKGCGGFYLFESLRCSLDGAAFEAWNRRMLQSRKRELVVGIQSDMQRQMALVSIGMITMICSLSCLVHLFLTLFCRPSVTCSTFRTRYSPTSVLAAALPLCKTLPFVM
jgi:hypothetical protein